MVEQVAKEVGDGVKVYQVDIDQNQETPTQFGIMAIPALLFFKGGKEVNRLGPVKKEVLLKAAQALKN